MYIGLNNLGLNSQNQAFSPASLFSAGEQGGWYDPSDLSTMYQDSAGTTPGVVGQPVGFIGDKRLGWVRGAEQWNDANVTFIGSASRVATNVYRILTPDGSLSSVQVNGSPLTIGKWYEVTFNVDSVAVAGGGQIGVGNGPDVNIPLSVGSKRCIFQSSTNAPIIKRAGASAQDFQISNVSFKELPGNHRTQTTAASRPVPSGRYNKVTAANANPTGLTGVTKAGDAASVLSVVSDAAAIAAEPTLARLCTLGTVYKLDNSAGATAAFANCAGASGNTNLHVASVYARGGSGAVGIQSPGVSSAFAASGDFTRRTVTIAAPSAAGNLYVQADAGQVVYFILPDMRDAADAALAIPSVQVITGTGAADYDSTGFPVGEDYDGLDDSTSSATGGGGTTGFFFCAAVRVAGGAGTSRMMFNDEGTNTGHSVFITTGNVLHLRAGDGATRTAVQTTATLPVGETHVVTAWHDVEAGTINVQIDNGTVASTAIGSIAAGTASFATGKSAAGSWFNGRLFSPIHRFGATVTASSRERVKRFVAARAGVTLA